MEVIKQETARGGESMNKNSRVIVPIAALAVVLLGWFAYSRIFSKKPESAKEITKKVEKEVAKKGAAKQKPLTAREAYKIAKAYGEKWSKDAVLVEVTNFMGGKNDGLASVWVFSFGSQSKEKDKGYEVTIVDGEFSRDENNVAIRFLSPVKDDWIDSDSIAKKSKTYFEGLTCKNYWYGLTGDEWKVKCSKEGGGKPKWVSLNAVTGEFIKTWEDY